MAITSNANLIKIAISIASTNVRITGNTDTNATRESVCLIEWPFG